MALDLTDVLGSLADVVSDLKYPEGTYLVLLGEDPETGGWMREATITSYWKKTRETTIPVQGNTRDIIVIFESEENTRELIDCGFEAVDMVFPDGTFERYTRKEFHRPDGATRKWKIVIELNLNDRTPTPA